MLYGYYIPFISMITSCLSCVSVSIEYFSNTYGWIIVREGEGPTFLGQEG